MNALVIARRELVGYFHTPIAYIVGVLFLVVQGLSFWALVEVLSDPGQAAPYGAVLSGFFGGGMLYWTVLLLVVSVLAMRLIAEERRQGTWELLLTTPVDVRSVLLGKWLGALAFYGCLWLPTLAYVLVLHGYAPPGVSIDIGPVAAAYLGVMLTGAGFLAIGIAASAATANQIVAAVATFVALLVLLMIGQLGELAPGWLADSPRVAAVIGWIDLRGQMARFAAGEIALGAIAFDLGLAAFGLALAAAWVAVGRRRTGEVQARFLAAGLVAAIAVLGNLIVAGDPDSWDVTARGTNSLDPRTGAVLDDLAVPVELLVARPSNPQLDDIWDQVDRVLVRMSERQPLLSRRDVDPAADPERMAQLAVEFGVAPADIKEFGAVVVRRGERRRVVNLLDLAEIGTDELGAGRLTRLSAEPALVGALLEVTAEDRPVVCATAGHGELPPAVGGGQSADWSGLARRLERDGMIIEEIGRVSAGVPAYCRVLVVFGPRVPLDADEALAVDRFAARGGGLLLVASGILDPRDDPPRLPTTGLELVIAEVGIRLPQAIAVDPDQGIDRLPGGFRVVSTYGEHPIGAAYQDRRFTIWQLPRVVVAPAEQQLVRTSASGWGETDLGRVGASTGADADDLPGPVGLAAAGERAGDTGGRTVVIGSARSLSSAMPAGLAGGGEALAATAVGWLLVRHRAPLIDDRSPEQLRLVMTDRDRTAVFILCVVIIPLVFAGFGWLAWRLRRRRSRREAA